MRDFTLSVYQRLIESLVAASYEFLTFREFLKEHRPKFVILRNDVDRNPANSLRFAKILSGFDIRGTFYFRILKQSFDPEIIREIHGLGHEIGYHYEDLSLIAAKSNFHHSSILSAEILTDAKESFARNLSMLRQYAPVDTICMHGRPLSKWDSRLMWFHLDYREFGILGEPYFDLNLSDTLYLTDTGRRWDGHNVSMRDKIVSGADGFVTGSQKTDLPAEFYIEPMKDCALNLSENAFVFQNRYCYRTTRNIIDAAGNQKLPDKLMITCHPQRWSDRTIPWCRELIAQNFKNIIKYFLVKVRQAS